MYATRIPAMQSARIDAGKIKRAEDLDGLPISAKQIADNYNHLHEQPVLFYALCFAAYLSPADDQIPMLSAWAYVGARVVHSLVQCTVNFVPLRFAIFAIGSVILMAMLVVEGLALLA
jgi:hypothetical protein